MNPIYFNYVILSLYALNAASWAWQRKWADAAYWLGAFWITSAVTFGYSR